MHARVHPAASYLDISVCVLRRVPACSPQRRPWASTCAAQRLRVRLWTLRELCRPRLVGCSRPRHTFHKYTAHEQILLRKLRSVRGLMSPAGLHTMRSIWLAHLGAGSTCSPLLSIRLARTVCTAVGACACGPLTNRRVVVAHMVEQVLAKNSTRIRMRRTVRGAGSVGTEGTASALSCARALFGSMLRQRWMLARGESA